MKWWRCNNCGEALLLAKSPLGISVHKKCLGTDATWHGPFDTEQAAREPGGKLGWVHDYVTFDEAVPDDKPDRMFPHLFTQQYPRWKAHTDYTKGVLWRADINFSKMNERIKAMMSEPFHFTPWGKSMFETTSKQSKEDTDMIPGTAFYCDGCKGTFPREKMNHIEFQTRKYNRAEEKVEEHTASMSALCDECFAALMAEPTVAKLPWTTWRKGDDDNGKG